MNTESFANALVARIYLCIGGVFGLHRLYCGQFFESILYQSTFGIFLLGPVHDVFYLNQMVRNYNDRQIKSDLTNEDEKSSTKRLPFSHTRFIQQVLYGVWLGFLSILLAAFLFKDTSDRLGLTLLCSFGVASGVWIVGNCGGNRSCSFLYGFIASLSTAFFTVYWSDLHTIRSLLITSVASALNSNRSQKLVDRNTLSIRHYMFCVSLLLTNFCIIWIGLSRSVFNREIGFVPKDSTFRIRTVDVGTFFMDYAFERRHQAYPILNHTIDYVPMVKFGGSVSNVPWKNNRKKATNSPHIQLVNLYRNFNMDLTFFDDQERVTEYNWLRYLTAFLVDYARISFLNEQAKEGEETNEALKVAMWRFYLIQSFGTDPFVSDEELLEKCKPFNRKSELSAANYRDRTKEDKTNWEMASRIKACNTLKIL